VYVDPRARAASVEVAVDARTAFDFMASGKVQTYWALGSWDRVDLGDALFSGTSLWDGSTLYVRPEPHRLTSRRSAPMSTRPRCT
jgi:hypothetical protein